MRLSYSVFDTDLKFTSYLMYVGCGELWKEPYITGFEFFTVILSGDVEP